MKDDKENCGFSCTYALKKVDSVLNELRIFYDYYPEKAREVMLEIFTKVNDSRNEMDKRPRF